MDDSKDAEGEQLRKDIEFLKQSLKDRNTLPGGPRHKYSKGKIEFEFSLLRLAVGRQPDHHVQNHTLCIHRAPDQHAA